MSSEETKIYELLKSMVNNTKLKENKESITYKGILSIVNKIEKLDTLKEKLKQDKNLYMNKLGHYEINNCTPEQERAAGVYNYLNKLLKDLEA